MGNDIKTCRFFLATVTDAFMAGHETKLRYCMEAAQKNIPMYLIIDEKMDWETNRELITYLIQNSTWRTPAGCQYPVQWFKTDEELDKILKTIKEDIRWIEKINNF